MPEEQPWSMCWCGLQDNSILLTLETRTAGFKVLLGSRYCTLHLMLITLYVSGCTSLVMFYAACQTLQIRAHAHVLPRSTLCLFCEPDMLSHCVSGISPSTQACVHVCLYRV